MKMTKKAIPDPSWDGRNSIAADSHFIILFKKLFSQNFTKMILWLKFFLPPILYCWKPPKRDFVNRFWYANPSKDDCQLVNLNFDILYITLTFPSSKFTYHHHYRQLQLIVSQNRIFHEPWGMSFNQINQKFAKSQFFRQFFMEIVRFDWCD